MPALPKFFIHNSLVMATSRIEEGLPLIPAPFVNRIIRSVLATAQTRYPVDLIAFVFQANHLHIVLRVLVPEDVPKFVGYVKQELAHRINRLLGRTKRTIWARGYDSPVILDRHKALKQIAYVMLNPMIDDLVEDMRDFPGVSSVEMFESETFEAQEIYIPRREVCALRDPVHPWRESSEVNSHFDVLATRESTLRVKLILKPYAWRHCFEETSELSDNQARTMMIEALNQRRGDITNRRNADKRRFFRSASDLVRRSMTKIYSPAKFAKRMLCLSDFRELREKFILGVKVAINKAKETFKEWGNGVFVSAFPPGFFQPGRPPIASITGVTPF